MRLPLTSSAPSTATRAVLWKPLVLEPSITILRMKWTSSITWQPSRAETMRAACTASASAACGGSSSASTRQETPGGAWYVKRIPRSACANAALSISPSSLWVGRRRRTNRAPCPSTSWERQEQKSLRVSSCWWTSRPHVTGCITAPSFPRSPRAGCWPSTSPPPPCRRCVRAPTSA